MHRQFRARNRLYRNGLLAVLRAFFAEFAQYHAGVIHEVLVYGKSAVGFAEVYPIGLNLYGAVALLQEQYVCNNARARIGKEGIIRQANSAEKICALRNVFAYGRVLFVHCAGGCDKYNYAAGTDFIQSLGDKIIVYEEAVLIVSLIRNAVIAEGHITYGNIEEAIGQCGSFISLYGDICVLIKLLCNAPRNAVQLYAV